MTLGPQFREYFPAEEIDAAFDSYPSHIHQKGMGEEEGSAYSAESLATIYEPRVRDLLRLKSEGFTHVRWGHDPEQGENRWFGVTPPSPEAGNP